MATQNIELAKGCDADGAVNKKRFVKLTGTQLVAQCDSAGENAYGVSWFSASLAEIAKGKGVSVITDGRAIVEAGDTSPVIGQPCATDNEGRAVLAGSGDYILGFFDEVPDGVDAGFEVSVMLEAAGAKVA